MAVQSNPAGDTPLRKNARKRKYPILEFGEWASGFCALVGCILIIVALAQDKLIHVDTEWTPNNLVEDVHLWITHDEMKATSDLTEEYEFNFDPKPLCDFPEDSHIFQKLNDTGSAHIIDDLCYEGKAWTGLLATAVTLGLIVVLAICAGKAITGVVFFGWLPCFVAMIIALILNGGGLIN